MKKQISLLSAAVVVVSLVGCGSEQKTQPATLDTADNKSSYLMGYEMARQMQRDGKSPNAEAMAQGARDALTDAAAKVVDKSVVEDVANTASSYVAVRKETLARQEAEMNLAAGQAFLAKNAKKEGVVTLASGLQYKVITEGTGASPSATDEVEVHYHGTLIDGTVFDSSVERGKTVSFPLNRVIPGWTEGLQLMKEGAKYELYIPANLAYGSRRRSAEIGPNMALIFEVELFKVNL